MSLRRSSRPRSLRMSTMPNEPISGAAVRTLRPDALEIHRLHRGRHLRHGARQAEPQIDRVQVFTSGDAHLRRVARVAVPAQQKAELVQHPKIRMAIHQIGARDAARRADHLLVDRAGRARHQMPDFASPRTAR